MLFGWIEDEKYIDLVDENGKLFKRFRTIQEYNSWCSQLEPSCLEGLSRKDTVVKWYESNTQLFKLVAPIVFLVFFGLRHVGLL